MSRQREDRVVIPHVDDVGGSHSANVAMRRLSEKGVVTSGSVMVPSPWFAESASLAGLASIDLGVHLTLNAESAAFRWKPISALDPSSGLLDESGYMRTTVPDLRENADPLAVKDELRAQIESAMQVIDVTHLDSHMGAALCPEFVEHTVDLAIEYRLPLVFPRELADFVKKVEVGEVDLDLMESQRLRAAEAGVAVGDRFIMPLYHRQPTMCREIITEQLSQTGPGISYLSLHCAIEGDITAIHPNDGYWRIEEYQLFTREDFNSWLRNQFTVKGMREIRNGIAS